MMDVIKIIDKYYKENVALRDILLIHSKAVTRRALNIADISRRAAVAERIAQVAVVGEGSAV